MKKFTLNETPEPEQTLDPLDHPETDKTKIHVGQVRKYMSHFISILAKRAVDHDRSKFSPEEVQGFINVSKKLKDMQYGSPEYREALKELKPTLDHHYANNSHHPEHYSDGMAGFDLYDLVECYCDWAAAAERMKNGNLNNSIEINAERFQMPEMLKNIFLNTFRRTDKDEIPQF